MDWGDIGVWVGIILVPLACIVYLRLRERPHRWNRQAQIAHERDQGRKWEPPSNTGVSGFGM